MSSETPNPSELETPAADTATPAPSLEQLLSRYTENMIWIRTALTSLLPLTNLLRGQDLSDAGETTPMGFSSPISELQPPIQQSAPTTPAPPPVKPRGEALLPTSTTLPQKQSAPSSSSNPTGAGLSPALPVETPLKTNNTTLTDPDKVKRSELSDPAPEISNQKMLQSQEKPREHFVEQVEGENPYDASSDSSLMNDQTMNKRYKNMDFWGKQGSVKFRKRKKRLKTRTKVLGFYGMHDLCVDARFSKRHLEVKKSRMKRSRRRKKKLPLSTSRRSHVPAFPGYEMFCSNSLGDPSENRRARQGHKLSAKEKGKGVLLDIRSDRDHHRGDSSFCVNDRALVLGDGFMGVKDEHIGAIRRTIDCWFRRGIVVHQVVRDEPEQPSFYGNVLGEPVTSTQARLSELDDGLQNWIISFEEHSGDADTLENRELQVVYHCIEGPGGWIKELKEWKPPDRWGAFTQMVRETRETPAEQPNQLRYRGVYQEGTVREYRQRFESRCMQTNSLPGTCWEEAFLQGLKPPLQDAVRRLCPQGIIQIMDTAQWLEEGEELMSLVIVEDSDEMSGFEEKCYIAYYNQQERFWVEGTILGHKVTVVIDSGATNNFLSRELATHLKLPTEVKDKVSVLCGHGISVESLGVCRGVRLLVQNIEIVEDYLQLDGNQPGIDLILGYKWLAKLGETWVNWKQKTMSFYHDTSWVTINGNKEGWAQETRGNYKLSLPNIPLKYTSDCQHLVLMVMDCVTTESNEEQVNVLIICIGIFVGSVDTRNKSFKPVVIAPRFLFERSAELQPNPRQYQEASLYLNSGTEKKKRVAAGGEKEKRDIELIIKSLIKPEKYQELLSLPDSAEQEQELVVVCYHRLRSKNGLSGEHKGTDIRDIRLSDAGERNSVVIGSDKSKTKTHTPGFLATNDGNVDVEARLKHASLYIAGWYWRSCEERGPEWKIVYGKKMGEHGEYLRSETEGYVGEDVESILYQLYVEAGCSVKEAQRGIVYIGEVDKMSMKSLSSNGGRDVSGEGVQLHFTEGATGLIARKAMPKNTGARGLLSILESILTEAMFEVPDSITEGSQGIKAVLVDEEAVGPNERRCCDDVQRRNFPTEEYHIAANKLTLFYLEDKIVLHGGSIDRSRVEEDLSDGTEEGHSKWLRRRARKWEKKKNESG